jgi:hypothetical protein
MMTACETPPLPGNHHRVSQSDDLPTARTTLGARYVRLSLHCGSCGRSRDADLQGLIDAGRGDVPLVNLRFRCSFAATAGSTKDRVLGPAR